MTDQEPISENSVRAKLTFYWQKLVSAMPLPVKAAFAKFYNNKKIFLPVSISFGVLFLVIVIGLLFGKPATTTSPSLRTSPTPMVTSIPQSSQPEDIITVTRNVLKDLKSEINALDVNQSILKPPSIDFEVGFN